jgi:hypothetical protein
VPNSVSVAVNYPATLSNYPDSVTAGIKDTISKIQTYVDTCGSSSKIVLLGYSQGGNVMTDVLAGGVDKPAPLADKYRQNSKFLVFDPQQAASRKGMIKTDTCCSPRCCRLR